MLSHSYRFVFSDLSFSTRNSVTLWLVNDLAADQLALMTHKQLEKLFLPSHIQESSIHLLTKIECSVPSLFRFM